MIGEFVSRLARVEQELRWSAEKVASIASADLFRERAVPSTSRLLVLRSTAANRELARRFEATMRAAYPARSAEAVRALSSGDRWPGDALIWVRIDGDRAEVIDGAPRGVDVGR